MATELNSVTGIDRQDVPGIFAGEGEMVRLVNEHDWENTPLGPISGWPDSIRSAVDIALGSTFQLVVLAGPELVYIYNDASTCIFGEKHPWALGKPTSLVWSEAWSTLGPMLHSVLDTGRALRHDDLLLVLQRYGYVEECYFTFSYSPIRSADGITGIFISVLETSERVVNERRLRTLSELAARVASGRGEQVYTALAGVLSDSLDDLPCTALYLCDAGDATRTVFHTGGPGGCIDASGAVRRALSTGQVQEFDAGEMLAPGVACGVWPEQPRHGLAYPLLLPGARQPCGVFVVGVNPRKALDAPHRSFVDFVAGHVATALANAEAARIEQERMAAMAELNRSRNAFFANASHELRTPLTLILGPLESLLAAPGGIEGGMREPVEMALRNALRMKRLVNSLLDFASIEAGRMQVRLERTDLARVTAGLASLFQPAFAAARVAFSVSAPPHPVDVLVDPGMWEKIVFNLLSNALKFTPEGKVELALREEGGMLVLSVSDTGVGIGAADLPHIFERFYRGAHRGQQLGTEGSGLGLALAAELVRLLDGTLRAQSADGAGTTIVARIPARRADAGSAAAAVGEARLNVQGAAILADALRAADARAAREIAGTAAGEAAPDERGLMKVVVVDDNADIVRYIECLLGSTCSVAAACDARAGLEAIRRIRPDIVLLDVMMPGIDGFELLRIIRGDESIQSIPVIILSAHAGEDARIAALAAGADDYLVKPFSARELAAMVRSHVHLVRTRRAATEREGRLLNQIAEIRNDLDSVMEGTSDAFLNVDADLRIMTMKKIQASLLRQPPEAMIGRVLTDVEPDFAPVAGALRRAMRERRTVGVHFLHRPSGRWFSVRCYPSGTGAVAFANEITRQKTAEAKLKQAHAELERRVLERTRDLNTANALLEAVFERSPAGIVMADFDGRIVRANAAFERLVGLAGRQLKALKIEDLADPSDAARNRMLFDQLRAGETHTFQTELRLRRPDGSVTWVENFVGTINGEDNAPRYIVKIVQDISSRKAAADEILASRNELRFLYDWLQHVRKDERLALAREVHDQLGQILSAAKIDIKLLLDDIQASSGVLPRRKLVAELSCASATLDQAIDCARSIATELRPPEIDSQGLYSAVEWHTRDFERRTRVRVKLDIPARKGGPAGAGAEALFRIFQEALTNILRHARATRVSVSLARRGGCILLRVRDNGVGIAPGRVRAAGTLGLVGMRERAALVRGRVAVRGLKAGGTLVSALLPVPDTLAR